ncbi:MAG: DNA-binding protein YbiB [Caldimonas sp.]|nr:MAG: DNA-binding protein YbiB [Caldimonas sp.]
MSIAPYIKEIGRGKEGARSLSREQAYDLMCQVLDGRISDLELGAFAIAMRIKGESVDELAGFLQATRERCLPIAAGRPLVVLPSYNGARKLPNLTALLALMLARAGVAVLVHGMPDDPNRVTTAEVFGHLGLAPAEAPSELQQRWSRGEPAYIRTERLCPPLARLLEVRWVIGLRNPGHTVAKLLDPGAGLRIVNYTHPEYGRLLTQFLQTTEAHAMLLRGTEGEPYADPRRTPRMDVFIAGQLRPELGVPAREGVLTELPSLPSQCDAAATARYIEAVMRGAQAVPAPLQRQLECLLHAVSSIPDTRTPAHVPTA